MACAQPLIYGQQECLEHLPVAPCVGICPCGHVSHELGWAGERYTCPGCGSDLFLDVCDEVFDVQ